MRMPTLETERLQIRPFVLDDLHEIHRILNAAFQTNTTLDEHSEWLRWAIMNVEQLAQLHQPPYGDRAVVLKQTGQLIGAVGFVPCLSLFARLPSFYTSDDAARYMTTEFGMFWGIDPAQQRQGYTTEAARAMRDYAFTQLRLRRIVATTDHANIASQGVMRKLGMRIERNPLPEPPWLQVAGILENTMVQV